MSTNTIREHMLALVQQRLAAERYGLAAGGPYIADLHHDGEAFRAPYVGAAVTEIAMLRADLSGRTLG